MSSADPFLPDPPPGERDAPLEREDYDLEDESEPDVFEGAPDGDAGASVGSPEHDYFSRPTGEEVDPRDDLDS